MKNIDTLEWESRYYSLAIRVTTVITLAALLLTFLFMPRRFEVQPYQLRKAVETVMEALPPELEEIAEPPKVEKPQMPVAAETEAEVEAEAIETTTFTEIIKRPEETDIPVVPFWKVEVKPTPVNVPTPVYPELARQAGIEGQAVVQALVDTDGSIIDAKILKSSGNTSLDNEAVQAAMRATFTPAKQRDQAVRVWVSIPYRFTLQ
ncbi:MAG: energy transducer TonB [candidate division WOR-3 bacterium]|nr:MAG: energy transducer TonB [candidate division WOR-3 bacterium]